MIPWKKSGYKTPPSGYRQIEKDCKDFFTEDYNTFKTCQDVKDSTKLQVGKCEGGCSSTGTTYSCCDFKNTACWTAGTGGIDRLLSSWHSKSPGLSVPGCNSQDKLDTTHVTCTFLFCDADVDCGTLSIDNCGNHDQCRIVKNGEVGTCCKKSEETKWYPMSQWIDQNNTLKEEALKCGPCNVLEEQEMCDEHPDCAWFKPHAKEDGPEGCYGSNECVRMGRAPFIMEGSLKCYEDGEQPLKCNDKKTENDCQLLSHCWWFDDGKSKTCNDKDGCEQYSKAECKDREDCAYFDPFCLKQCLLLDTKSDCEKDKSCEWNEDDGNGKCRLDTQCKEECKNKKECPDEDTLKKTCDLRKHCSWHIDTKKCQFNCNTFKREEDCNRFEECDYSTEDKSCREKRECKKRGTHSACHNCLESQSSCENTVDDCGWDEDAIICRPCITWTNQQDCNRYEHCSWDALNGKCKMCGFQTGDTLIDDLKDTQKIFIGCNSVYEEEVTRRERCFSEGTYEKATLIKKGFEDCTEKGRTVYTSNCGDRIGIRVYGSKAARDGDKDCTGEVQEQLSWNGMTFTGTSSPTSEPTREPTSTPTTKATKPENAVTFVECRNECCKEEFGAGYYCSLQFNSCGYHCRSSGYCYTGKENSLCRPINKTCVNNCNNLHDCDQNDCPSGQKCVSDGKSANASLSTVPVPITHTFYQGMEHSIKLLSA